MTDTPAPTNVPDIGDLFTHEGSQYRVETWLREMPPRPVPAFLLAAGIKPRTEPRMVWCVREEATHVSGCGVSGVILPITEVTVEGRVDWSEAVLAEQREFALILVGQDVV